VKIALSSFLQGPQSSAFLLATKFAKSRGDDDIILHVRSKRDRRCFFRQDREDKIIRSTLEKLVDELPEDSDFLELLKRIKSDPALQGEKRVATGGISSGAAIITCVLHATSGVQAAEPRSVC
jgi:hypothetical protein